MLSRDAKPPVAGLVTFSFVRLEVLNAMMDSFLLQRHHTTFDSINTRPATSSLVIADAGVNRFFDYKNDSARRKRKTTMEGIDMVGLDWERER